MGINLDKANVEKGNNIDEESKVNENVTTEVTEEDKSCVEGVNKIVDFLATDIGGATRSLQPYLFKFNIVNVLALILVILLILLKVTGKEKGFVPSFETANKEFAAYFAAGNKKILRKIAQFIKNEGETSNTTANVNNTHFNINNALNTTPTTSKPAVFDFNTVRNMEGIKTVGDIPMDDGVRIREDQLPTAYANYITYRSKIEENVPGEVVANSISCLYNRTLSTTSSSSRYEQEVDKHVQMILDGAKVYYQDIKGSKNFVPDKFLSDTELIKYMKLAATGYDIRVSSLMPPNPRYDTNMPYTKIILNCMLQLGREKFPSYYDKAYDTVLFIYTIDKSKKDILGNNRESDEFVFDDAANLISLIISEYTIMVVHEFMNAYGLSFDMKYLEEYPFSWIEDPSNMINASSDLKKLSILKEEI